MSPVIALLLALLFSAFFSGMEIAFVSSNRLKFEIDRKHGVFASGITSAFYSNPGHFIATMLVGNNIALVIYGIIAAQMLKPILLNKLVIQNEFLILFIQTVIATIVILFTAEFLPKTVFRSRPNSAMKLFSIPAFFLYIILYPLTIITLGLTNFIMRVFLGIRVRSRSEYRNPVFGKIDLDNFVSESHSLFEKNLEDEPEQYYLLIFASI